MSIAVSKHQCRQKKTRCKDSGYRSINVYFKLMHSKNKLAVGIAIGIGIGTAVGVATDNLGLWIGVGIAIGAAVGTTLMNKDKKHDDDKNL